MNLKSLARDLWLMRTFRNGAKFVLGLRTGRFPNEAVFWDGYALKHPPGLAGLAEVVLEVMQEQVYTPAWFYTPSPHDTIVDFGANVGVFSIGEARRNATARIIAVEAHPEIFQQLKRNAAPFSQQIMVHHAAVQGVPGEVRLRLTTTRSLDIQVAQVDGDDCISVPGIDFGDVMKLVGDGEIALLKCDIEGAEADVFEGASEATLRRIRNIALEFHDNLRPGTKSKLWTALSKTHRLLHLDDNNGCGIMLWKRTDLGESPRG